MNTVGLPSDELLTSFSEMKFCLLLLLLGVATGLRMPSSTCSLSRRACLLAGMTVVTSNPISSQAMLPLCESDEQRECRRPWQPSNMGGKTNPSTALGSSRYTRLPRTCRPSAQRIDSCAHRPGKKQGQAEGEGVCRGQAKERCRKGKAMSCIDTFIG